MWTARHDNKSVGLIILRLPNETITLAQRMHELALLTPHGLQRECNPGRRRCAALHNFCKLPLEPCDPCPLVERNDEERGEEGAETSLARRRPAPRYFRLHSEVDSSDIDALQIYKIDSTKVRKCET